MSADRHVLPGSDRNEIQPHGLLSAPKVHPQERIEVTMWVDPHKAEGEDSAEAVATFAKSFGLHYAGPGPAGSYTLKLDGTCEAMETAFGVELVHREHEDGGTFRSHYGPVMVPVELAGIVTHVFGLDNRPCAKPHVKKSNWVNIDADFESDDNAEPKSGWFNLDLENEHGGATIHTAQVPPGAFTPPQVGKLYNFPADYHGWKQTIALIELGGGFKPADIHTYFTSLGLPVPTVVPIGVDGGKNQPGSDADGEVMLDICVAGGICPKSTIAVYFAANTDQGFSDAILAAVHDNHYKPSVISISWGGPEDQWSKAALSAMDLAFQAAKAKGITVLVAAGDSGSSDGETDGKNHVDYPASSQWVTGCGGTKLLVTNGVIYESVWNEMASGEGATGGGISALFGQPSYQVGVSTSTVGRGVPDVAGVADPTTGFYVRVDGQFVVEGGTSGVAPLYAGLIALVNEATGKRIGFLNPHLYAHPAVCREVTVGSNGAFNAAQGWSPTVGLGAIDGTKLLDSYRAS